MEINPLLTAGLGNLDLIEEMYELYKQDPSRVDHTWKEFFSQLDFRPDKPSSTYVSAIAERPALTPEDIHGKSVLYYPKVEITSETPDLRVENLINAYRTYGYLLAHVNNIEIKPSEDIYPLDLERFGFTKQDLSSYFSTHGLLDEEKAPLLEIINTLKEIYCNRIGVEYKGLHNPEMERWLQEHIEATRFRLNLSMEEKHMILQHLNKSELFESFLHTKYVGQKRFSLEGGETLIPMIAAIIDKGATLGIEECIFGMPHRGRLNVLCNIFDKSYADIFSEFEDSYIPASVEGSGDVKYHKGFYSEVKSVHGHQLKLTLTPNPSHLESVDPVVEGRVRARQTIRESQNALDQVLPLLVHGDAAIAGQGIVYETLQMSKLPGYKTGGTIHIVINNQIGFTTIPEDGRSTLFCTDIARTFSSPVFHVNAEDPEGCVYAANLAIELRQRFHCDVFIDLNCYRKYGHNETDEPAFTQPLEYQLIKKKQPIRDIYRDQLINQGLLEKKLAESLESEFKKSLHEAQATKAAIAKAPHTEQPSMAAKNGEIFSPVDTGVSAHTLQQIATTITSVPEDFVIHPKLAILNKERLLMVKEGGERPIDWGMAELLAYGSLLWEGTHVRLSGQDSCRGTFSHRHAVLVDQMKERAFTPLQHLRPGQGRFEVYNSPLSEFSVLGFEYGYNIAYPTALVLWEAQFGDFANSAQVMIDQYIASGEQKWNLKSSLVLLLPHGYEGQGPEHSSGRMERFLTLAGDNNMQIVNPTTPAQLFHLLRRQIIRPLKMPLVVFTPKGLLRHPACVSHLSDLTQGSFQEIIDDPIQTKKPQRLILCSGRIYYDINAERERLAFDDMAIVRIEQLYPLNIEALNNIIRKYSSIKECIWVQEEPSNMGAWNFMRPILREVLPNGIEPHYIGRTRSASPAVGSHSAHKKEHAAILAALFGIKDPAQYHITGQIKA